MPTVQRRSLTPALGAGVHEQVELAGCGDEYRHRCDFGRRVRAPARSGYRPAAPYAICLGYPIRSTLDLNAREAMRLTELRAGREGHPIYRAVAHEMHAQIASVHPAVAAPMVHIDRHTRAATRADPVEDAAPIREMLSAPADHGLARSYEPTRAGS